MLGSLLKSTWRESQAGGVIFLNCSSSKAVGPEQAFGNWLHTHAGEERAKSGNDTMCYMYFYWFCRLQPKCCGNYGTWGFIDLVEAPIFQDIFWWVRLKTFSSHSFLFLEAINCIKLLMKAHGCSSQQLFQIWNSNTLFIVFHFCSFHPKEKGMHITYKMNLTRHKNKLQKVIW